MSGRLLARVPDAILALIAGGAFVVRIESGSATWVLLPWFLFFAVPAWLWRHSPHPHWARAIHLGVLHNLVVLSILAVLDPGLAVGRWLWAASLLVPLVRTPHPRSADVAWLNVGGVAVGAVGLGAWMFLTRGAPAIFSDGPAHLAAVHDALAANRWLPPDSGNPGASTDPRFGVAHGLYAAVTRGHSPVEVMALLPVVITPLWFLGHGRLFQTLGATPWMAWAMAGLFTVAGAGGRGFGLWSSSYPGNLALALATFGLAEWIEATARGRYLRALGGIVAVALTAWIHPFGWWGVSVGMLLAGLLLLAQSEARDFGRRVFVGAIGSVGIGALVMLPRLLDRGASADGLHMQVTDALTVTEHLFLTDPFWLMRWGGWVAVCLFPLTLVVVGRWTPRTTVAFAFAAMPWLISLNPVLHPLAWSVASYLSVRLIRLTYSPLVVALLVVAALDVARRSRWFGSRVMGSLALLVAIFLLGVQLRDAGQQIGRRPGAASVAWAQAEPVVTLLARLDRPKFAADPRTSYLVRAMGGPVASILPVAHASPKDRDLAQRLRHYRSLLDPLCPPDSVQVAVRTLDASVLVLNHDADRIYPQADFGFVFSPERSRQLEARLLASGLTPLATAPGVSVFSADDIQAATIVPGPEPSEATPPTRLDLDIRGDSYAVHQVQIEPSAVRAGDTVQVTTWVRPAPPRPGNHPEWQRLTLRFQGPMRTAPEWTRPVGKLVRKLLLERSGRSPARFHSGWFPFDGTRPPSRWAGPVSETRTVRIPPWATPGVYDVQVTVREAPWRTRLPLSDYLRDEDSLSGPSVGTLEVLAP